MKLESHVPKVHWGVCDGSLGSLAHCGISQTIRLGILFPAHVRNRKSQSPRQLQASPMKGVKAGTTAGIFAAHLPDHNFGVRENMQGLRFQRKGALQSFHQRHILRDIVG